MAPLTRLTFYVELCSVNATKTYAVYISVTVHLSPWCLINEAIEDHKLSLVNKVGAVGNLQRDYVKKLFNYTLRSDVTTNLIFVAGVISTQ